MKLPQLNIAKFKTFVSESGAELVELTNPYELIRFRCKHGVGIVYRNKHRQITLVGAAILAYEFFSRGRDWVAGKTYLDWERPEVVERLMARDGDICFYCGGPLGDAATVEHILSITDGGSSADANLCLVHSLCNLAAGSLPVVEKVLTFFKRK
jgi:hypothetical protein